ncbi:MAG: CPBP family intramembrane metalloprotease [Bacteroidetes bacterium]|nr:MAG: CPBP family intramembrane metalloprotease [Bacteroidota bacterium]
MQHSRSNPVYIIGGFMIIAIALKKDLMARVLVNTGIESLVADQLSTIFHNGLLIGFSIWAMRRLGLNRLTQTGITPVRDWPLLIYPFGIMLLLGFGNMQEMAKVSPGVLLLFFLGMMAIGFSEEYAFRGFIQTFLIDRFRSRWAVLIAAALFGLVHFMNLFRAPDSLVPISKQVLFATGIGVYFGALLLRTRALWMMGVFHGMLDFIFGSDEITAVTAMPAPVTPSPQGSGGIDLIYVFPAIFLFTGWYLIKDIHFEPVEDQPE